MTRPPAKTAARKGGKAASAKAAPKPVAKKAARKTGKAASAKAKAKAAPAYDPFGKLDALPVNATEANRRAKQDAAQEKAEDGRRELLAAMEAREERRDGRLGNRFWQARSSHGRNPKFTSAAKLQAACEEYFEWVAANPLWEDKFYTADGIPGQHEIAKMRPMTLAGLCNFLDIVTETWRLYAKRDGFIGVCKGVEQIIYQHKFDGAAAGFLNANIIARDLGLAEKVENPQGALAVIAGLGKMNEAQLEELIASLATGGDGR